VRLLAHRQIIDRRARNVACFGGLIDFIAGS